MRKYQDAKQQLQELSEDTPLRLNAMANAYQAECAMALGDFGEAESLIQLAIQQDATLPNGHTVLGILSMQTGKPEEARNALERAAELDPVMTVFSFNSLTSYVN